MCITSQYKLSQQSILTNSFTQYSCFNPTKKEDDDLKNLLTTFESKGLTQIQGKNVSVITKQLHATVVSLDEVGALPDETYGDILNGFTKCSNEDFKAVQDF